MQDFDFLISEAQSHPFSGWNFSYIRNRMREQTLPWDYRRRVREAFASANTLLDVGTGGGEFLASLEPLPPRTYATETFAPNVPIAKARLEPFGVRVHAIESENDLPFPNGFFDLVINRHEAVFAGETERILKNGGRFITQQVGERNLRELNEWLQIDIADRPSYCQETLTSIRQADLEIVESCEAFAETVFDDVGAIVYFLQAVPWQAPSFSIEKCYAQLLSIHEHIQTSGRFIARHHRFYIEARKP